MPLHCPRCQIAQAEENKTCINCGQPLTPAPARPAAPAPAVEPIRLAQADAASRLTGHKAPGAPDPVHAVQSRRASWKLPAFLALGLLLALVASALVAKRRPGAGALPPASSQAQASQAQASQAQASQAQVPAAPPVPAAIIAPPSAPALPSAGIKAAEGTKAADETTPLTVALASTSDGRHVQAGSAVTLTAFTSLARGRSAALTLLYRRGRGRATTLAFAQGSLCSTTWTPPSPGRYEFTATALGDRRQAAVSRRVAITVDAPALPPAATAAPPLPVAASPAPRTAARVKRPVAARPASPLVYHVAAAHFPFLRNATVLSDALSRRGYPAVPEPMTGKDGKVVYVVVTGRYRRPQEARKAVLALQRSGYPAYFFSSR